MKRVKPSTPEDFDVWTRNAVSKFNELTPMLRAFAREMTGNPKLDVRITGNTPCTDGKAIYLRPTPALGRETVHDRSLCHVRDEHDSTMLCPACAAHEEVMIVLYHEIGHIAADSFQHFKRYNIDALADESVITDEEAQALDAKFGPPDSDTYEMNFLEAASVISPWLPMVLNATEDARVNRSMFSTYPGTKAMFDGLNLNTFVKGFEQPDGSTIKWSDQPTSPQAIIGLYVKASGYDYAGWFLPEVEAALEDPRLDALCASVNSARNVNDVFAIAIPCLRILQEHGFCADEDAEESEPGRGDPGDGDGANGEGSKDDEGSEGSSGSGDADGKSSDGADGSGDKNDSGDQGPAKDVGVGSTGSSQAGSQQSDADKSSRQSDSTGGAAGGVGDGTPGQASDALNAFNGHADMESDDPLPFDENVVEEAFRRIERQMEAFDYPSTGIGGVDHTSGASAEKMFAPIARGGPVKVSETIIAGALAELRVTFGENRKSKHRRNLRSGEVDVRNLARRVPLDDDRIFGRVERPGKRSYFVLIGLDVSGSTSCPGVLELIKQAGAAKAEMLNRLGIPFAVYAHSGTDSSVSPGMLDVALGDVKTPDQAWDDAARDRLSRLKPFSANLDGHTLEAYRKIVEKSRATDRIVLYYNDGAMPAENYHEELATIHREVEEYRKRKITMLGVGVGTDEPAAFMPSVRIDSIEDVNVVIKALQDRLGVR